MRNLGWLFATVALVAAAGCAPQTPGGAGSAAVASTGRQCFNTASVNGFQLVDDRTVDLMVGANRVFRATVFGTCPDVRDAVSVGVRGRGGSSFVCDDQDVELVVPGSLGARLCPVTAIRQRTRAELDAERAARR